LFGASAVGDGLLTYVGETFTRFRKIFLRGQHAEMIYAWLK
jgi:hypothetical protein